MTTPAISGIMIKNEREDIMSTQYTKYVARKLQASGFTDIKIIPESDFSGADITAVSKSGASICVRCEYDEFIVDANVIEETLNAKSALGCRAAMIVTNSTFTEEAKNLAKQHGIMLKEAVAAPQASQSPAVTMEAQNVNINSGVKSMVICRHCGAKIAKTAKVCPKCGGKNKKPIYKRWWFIVLAVFLGISIIGSLGGGDGTETADTSGTNNTVSANVSEDQQTQETQEPEITYTVYSVAELVNDLGTNALKASEKYKNQYVELTGRLDSIDSNGAHISVYPGVEMYEFQGVTCYIKTPEQKTAVMDMEIGDTVVVKGKITDVGEFLGYYLNIDEVSKAQ